MAPSRIFFNAKQQSIIDKQVEAERKSAALIADAETRTIGLIRDSQDQVLSQIPSFLEANNSNLLKSIQEMLSTSNQTQDSAGKGKKAGPY